MASWKILELLLKLFLKSTILARDSLEICETDREGNRGRERGRKATCCWLMTVEDKLAELQFITDLSAFNNFKLSIIIISLSLSLFNYCLHCLLAIFSYFLAGFSTIVVCRLLWATSTCCKETFARTQIKTQNKVITVNWQCQSKHKLNRYKE